MSKPYVKKLNELNINNIDLVGGKNASLGEMISELTDLGIKVPGGFATTSYAYQDFLNQDDLGKRINNILNNLNVDNIEELAETGRQIRQWILETKISSELKSEIEKGI